MLQVELAKHVLLLREKLRELNRVAELTKLDKQARNLCKQRSLKDPDKERSERHLGRDMSSYSVDSDLDREQELIVRCLRLLLGKQAVAAATNSQILAASSTGSDLFGAMVTLDSVPSDLSMTDSQLR